LFRIKKAVYSDFKCTCTTVTSFVVFRIDLLFKKSEGTTKTLKTKDFFVVGTYYHQKEISKLTVANKDYKSKASTLIEQEKTMQRIFQYTFINKPVKLVPEPNNKHDKNAVKVIIAGEHVGYIKREECSQVKNIIKNKEIKYISAFISGGKYKIVNNDGSVEKDELDISINIRIAYV